MSSVRSHAFVDVIVSGSSCGLVLCLQTRKHQDGDKTEDLSLCSECSTSPSQVIPKLGIYSFRKFICYLTTKGGGGKW